MWVGAGGRARSTTLGGSTELAHGLADAGADVDGPLPSGFVSGAPDGHAADMNHLEAPLLEESGLVGRVETLQD